MVDFQDIGQTQWERYSTAEVRSFARGLSGEGIAADARAIGSAGNKHADSLAELQRDSTTVSERWRGEAKDESYAQMGGFVARAYTNAVEFQKLVRNVDALSGTAAETNLAFSDLPDPPSSGVTGTIGSTYRSAVGEAVKRTYSSPVRTSASSLPLGAARGGVVFDHIGPANDKGDNSAATAPAEPDAVTPAAGTGGGGGGAPSDSTTETSPTGPATTIAVADQGDPATAETDTATRGTGAEQAGAQQSGAGTGGASTGGTGTGETGAGEVPGTGDGTDPGLDEAGQDPAADPEAPSSLLSPAAAVPLTPTARTGTGLSGITGGGRADVGRADVGRAASPLGLRQDAAAVRAAAAPVGAGGSGTGARPDSGPYGMPAAGAGGQRGQGDGRHRVPAYLIDRRNGEELVGDMPLVGPGVIGQWNTDAADAPRAPAPPARGEPRPR